MSGHLLLGDYIDVLNNMFDDINEDVAVSRRSQIGIYQKSSRPHFARAHPPWEHRSVLPAALAL